MGVGRGAGGVWPPLDFEIIRKKVVFQFRGVKNKFHHFWPPSGKNFGKIPYWPPLEKILPMPMVVCVHQSHAGLPFSDFQ